MEDVLRWTTDHGVDPTTIRFDVSERLLSAEISTVREHLVALRQRGFGVALDDFGASGTSLSWLQDLPIDVLKLDRRFTSSLEEASTRAVVEAIVHLASALGMVSLAEGVESTAQLETLARLGCDYAQGLHIAVPMAADDFTARPRQRGA